MIKIEYQAGNEEAEESYIAIYHDKIMNVAEAFEAYKNNGAEIHWIGFCLSPRQYETGRRIAKKFDDWNAKVLEARGSRKR